MEKFMKLKDLKDKSMAFWKKLKNFKKFVS